MNFDFASLMLIAVVITGIVWLIDIYHWAPKRAVEVARLEASSASEEELEQAAKESLLVEYSKSFFPVILIVLLLRSFLVEPFRIPSGSMIPTLRVGDFILVNKFSYGVRLPVINTKFLDTGLPQRGDVVVFRFPKDPSVDYIKRVIGLPGDRVEYRNKVLYVNGQRIEHKDMGPFIGNSGLPIPGLAVLNETLDGVSHTIMHESGKPVFNGSVLVPEGHYFVMGDNRDNSNDSRFWGTVPEENLVGRAFMIWMNWNFDEGGIEWSRIGNSIE
ncbi:MAG: signal peptidase I [Gammaproteobacteria bacterium]|nr:signal peptidase I [Gammaproteobacteria bacterium]